MCRGTRSVGMSTSSSGKRPMSSTALRLPARPAAPPAGERLTVRPAPRSRPGVDDLGPYERGKPVGDVQRELGLERVVKLASNEGPFPPLPAALEALARCARELNRYPDGGMYRL